MENKYYTPDISEFHVGFEYEALTHKQNNSVAYIEEEKNNWIWVDTIFGANAVNYADFKFDFRYEDYNSFYTRVKYLDKSDIESLGFELTEESDVDDIFFLKFNTTRYELEYFNWYVGAKDTETTEYRMLVIKRKQKDEENGVALFRGEIKNKSELNKLLKQLRIIDNE